MAQIGTFTRAEDGSYTGTIKTLSLNIKARFLPADASGNEKAPNLRIMAGNVEIGAAWQRTSKDNTVYHSVKLDDPSFPAPPPTHLAGMPRRAGRRALCHKLAISGPARSYRRPDRPGCLSPAAISPRDNSSSAVRAAAKAVSPATVAACSSPSTARAAFRRSSISLSDRGFFHNVRAIEFGMPMIQLHQFRPANFQWGFLGTTF
jgi:uncharacterized protein (DUF736 family)